MDYTGRLCLGSAGTARCLMGRAHLPGPRLPRQPRDSRMVHPKGLGDLAATFSGFEPGDRLTLLMAVELGFAAEFGASRPRWRA
jgi:hypothetical protein